MLSAPALLTRSWPLQVCGSVSTVVGPGLVPEVVASHEEPLLASTPLGLSDRLCPDAPTNPALLPSHMPAGSAL